MELKVLCDCGQKFKFDVEPVNGRMPFAVNCPVCNADGTSKANELISQQMVVSSVVADAPPAIAPLPPATGGLRIKHTEAHAPASPPPIAPATANDNPPPAIGAARPFAVNAAANPPKKTSFGMGLLGGLTGALVGSVAYFFIYKFTGLHLKLLALGVGALAGWLAELLGKGEGSKELGGITAALTVAGVIGAQYFVVYSRWHQFENDQLNYAKNAYAMAVIEAGQAIKMIPTGSDAEIRSYLAKTSRDAGIKVLPSDFSTDDVNDFRENQLPELKQLASGQMTKDEYDTTHDIKALTARSANGESDDSTFKGLFLLSFCSVGNIIALVAAAGLAFKLSANA